MWRKFQKVGEDMALLSTNLAATSHDFYQEQVGEEFAHETPPQNCEKNCKAIVVAKHSTNCVVCERLEISEPNVSLESSVSIYATSRLCKHCGTCEEEEKRFLICGHGQCPYKYYHIRCLKSGQIASFEQQGNECWYCPSCLCRACFLDRDDGLIVLCDGCDEAYHTYCMKPPRGSVPEGRWYCLGCSVGKAKEGMRKYEEWILERHGGKEVRRGGEEGSRSMDALLSAVEKLSSEENLSTF